MSIVRITHRAGRWFQDRSTGHDAQAQQLGDEVGIGLIIGGFETVVLDHPSWIGQLYPVASIFESIDEPIPVVGGFHGNLFDSARNIIVEIFEHFIQRAGQATVAQTLAGLIHSCHD